MAIQEQGKNKYKIVVPIGYNGNKRIRHIETFYGTKKEAILRENEIKLELKNNTYIAKKNITVYMFIQEWLKSRKNTVAVKTYKNYVNHIHLSVPHLEYVEKIKEHQTLKKVLGKIDYDGYLSIEMKNQNDINKVQKAVLYLKENF